MTAIDEIARLLSAGHARLDERDAFLRAHRDTGRFETPADAERYWWAHVAPRPAATALALPLIGEWTGWLTLAVVVLAAMSLLPPAMHLLDRNLRDEQRRQLPPSWSTKIVERRTVGRWLRRHRRKAGRP